MKNESEKIKEIIEREGKIKESILNLNFIINLLDDCESENEKIQFVALRSTHRVFEHLLSLEDFAKILLEFKKNSENKKQKVEEDAKNELLNFLKQNYQDFFQLLFNFLSSPKQSTKIVIYEIIMSLISKEVKSFQKYSKEYSDITFEFATDKLANRTLRLIKEIIGLSERDNKNKKNKKNNNNNEEVFLLYQSQFANTIREQFHSYYDLRFYLLKHLKTIMKGLKNTNENIEKISANIFELIREFPFQSAKNDSFFGLIIHSSSAISNNSNNQSGKRKRSEIDSSSSLSHVLEYKEYKKKYEEVWFSLLQLKLTAKTYKQILSEFPSILNHFNHPENTLDFLKTSYNLGSLFSILSLNSLFILITKFNLDFPQFYEKLYNLIEVSIFHTKHSVLFVQSLKKFLSSKYLPDYLCAAFCKKLIRVILLAPAPSALPILPFIYNLIADHPQMVVLIHRIPNWQKGSVLLVSDDSFAGLIDKDPFDISQTNPALSNAIDSSLWELSVMKNHYFQSISRFTKAFDKPIPPRKKAYDLEDFISSSNGYFIEFNTQSKRKTKTVAAPLAVKPSTRLFAENEFSSWKF